jgi:sialate O-acetylesterase
LQGFEIAGADGKWNWAEAAIEGGAVVVRNGGIPSPTQVRYAYSPSPSYANLFNRDGLPALTFTTETLRRAAMPSNGR